MENKLNKKKNIFKDIKSFTIFFTNNNLIFFSFIYLLFISINILLYLLFINKYPGYIDLDNNLNLNALTHSYSEITNNIINNNKFTTKILNFGIDFHIARLPIIPFFISYVYLLISKKFLYIFLIKNIILFSYLIFIIKKILKNNLYVLLFFLILFYNPFNSYNLLMLIPEEGYINFLVLSLFFIFISNLKYRTCFLTLTLILLFFTKGSFCFFIYPVILFLFLVEKKSTPIISISICFLLWFSYAYIKTKNFISPFSLISIGGVTLASSSNDEFNKIYPLQSPDILYKKILEENKHLYENLNNEMDIDKVFKNYTLNYILNNKIDFLIGVSKKIKVIFFNFKKDAQVISSDGYNKTRYSNYFNILTLYLTIFLIIYKIYLRKLERKDYFYIVFFFTYLFPFMIGFVYTRHVVPIYLLSHFYLYIEILEKKQKILL